MSPAWLLSIYFVDSGSGLVMRKDARARRPARNVAHLVCFWSHQGYDRYARAVENVIINGKLVAIPLLDPGAADCGL